MNTLEGVLLVADWRDAHLRLSSTLPSRIHTHDLEMVRYTPRETQRRGVVVRGRRYDSFRECAQNLKVSHSTIRRWITEGVASYG